RQHDLPGAERLDLARPGNRVASGGPAAAVRVDAEASVLPPGVDGDHDALAAEALRGLPDYPGVVEGSRVQRDLVRPRAQQHAHVLHAPDAAADRERDVDALGRPADDVEHDLPV